MWPLTGGCHYSYNCTGYSAKCGRCPELASDHRLDLSRLVLHRKMHAYHSNLHFVAISRWLAEAARHSAPLAGREIAVIPNSVDVRRYLPVERDTARHAHGLPTDARLIVFGALAATTDSRKGFDYLIQIAEQLRNDDTLFLVFGAHGDERLSRAAQGRVHFLGTLHDSLSLNLAYAAGDVFVAPSLQEAFGKTVFEAMARGTPVVAFETIGAADIIDHRVDGYLAAHGSADDLIAGIEWVTADADRAVRMRHAAREKAVRSVSDDVIARKYLDFYRSVLSRQAAG
jgi:glycosyltransferase involved in cell wall biosynthesis